VPRFYFKFAKQSRLIVYRGCFGRVGAATIFSAWTFRIQRLARGQDGRGTGSERDHPARYQLATLGRLRITYGQALPVFALFGRGRSAAFRVAGTSG
jgi:hypothetical protein